jgi:hypothetical protein
MKLPRNGTPLANASLMALGAMAGAAVTWWTATERTPTDDFANSREGLPNRRPSARNLALNERVDGRNGAPEKSDPLTLGALDRSAHFREAGGIAADHDLRGALDDAAEITSAKDRADYLRGVFAKWAESDPEGALNHAIGAMEAGQLQSDAIGIAIQQWAQDHPREAWLWAEKSLTGPLKERALTDLMMGWTRRNPQEAADWVASTGLTSQPLFSALPGVWAEADPTAALAWARTLPPGKARDTAEVAIANTVAHNDPLAAAEMFADRMESGDNAALAITIADIWSATDPAAAADWVANMAEGPGKIEAAATLATVWAATDIQAAVSWSQSITDDSMRRQVISNIGTSWGAIDPHDALAWLGTLPPDVSTDGVTGAMYSWAGTDPVGLRQWIDEVPENPMADRARQSLADVLSQEAIPEAMDVAIGMQSTVARDAALARYFAEWRKRDDASAQDWLESNWATLPDTARQSLGNIQGRGYQPK